VDRAKFHGAEGGVTGAELGVSEPTTASGDPVSSKRAEDEGIVEGAYGIERAAVTSGREAVGSTDIGTNTGGAILSKVFVVMGSGLIIETVFDGTGRDEGNSSSSSSASSLCSFLVERTSSSSSSSSSSSCLGVIFDTTGADAGAPGAAGAAGGAGEADFFGRS
jgi:hypothetical protein